VLSWTDFRARSVRMLADSDREKPTWDDDDLRDYVNEALEDVAWHTAQLKTYSLSLKAVTQIDLPEDFLALGPVWVTDMLNNKILMEQARLVKGQTYAVLAQSSQTMMMLYPRYYQWPDGKLSFVSPLTATLSLDYYGYWDEVVDDDSQMTVPRWMLEALKWVILEKCMHKQAIGAAMLRQYNTKQDSGSPEDNPLLKQAADFHRKYEQVLASHPTQDRSGWEGWV